MRASTVREGRLYVTKIDHPPKPVSTLTDSISGAQRRNRVVRAVPVWVGTVSIILKLKVSQTGLHQTFVLLNSDEPTVLRSIYKLPRELWGDCDNRSTLIATSASLSTRHLP